MYLFLLRFEVSLYLVLEGRNMNMLYLAMEQGKNIGVHEALCDKGHSTSL
jgi:hypothetical protein